MLGPPTDFYGREFLGEQQRKNPGRIGGELLALYASIANLLREGSVDSWMLSVKAAVFVQPGR